MENKIIKSITKSYHKSIGIGLLSIPIFVLLLFTAGEVLVGDMSGFSHLIQIAPLLLVLLLSLKKPFFGGILLLASGIILGMLYPLAVPFEVNTILLVEVMLFLPPIVSGILLMLSSKK